MRRRSKLLREVHEAFGESGGAVLHQERGFVRSVFTGGMQFLSRQPDQRVPPEECGDEISEKIPGRIIEGEVGKFMGEYRFPLRGIKHCEKCSGKTIVFRNTPNAIGLRRAGD